MDEYKSLSHSKWECKYHVALVSLYCAIEIATTLRALR